MAGQAGLLGRVARYRYVALNTAISLIAFLRNVLFMRTLGIEDLAQVAIMQTLVMLIGFAQGGAINGAYVLMAEKKADQDRQVTDFLWAGLGVLALGFAALALLGTGVPGAAALAPAFLQPVTLALGIVAGLATLASSFLNNALIAHGALDRSNAVGMGAVLISLGLGVLSLEYGLVMALAAILAQPVLIALGVLGLTPALRPALAGLRRVLAGWLAGELARRIFAVGFPQFLGTLFILMGYQLERWAIVAVLGEEALGQFYLVIMYITFFVLVPGSIVNLHFPPALRHLQAGEMAGFERAAGNHVRDLAIFCAIALPATVLPLPWLLESFLPQFAGQERLIWWAYPAMVVFVARDTCSLVFLAVKQTRPMVVSGAIFFAAYGAGIGALVAADSFTLESLLAARLVAALAALIYALAMRRALLAPYREKARQKAEVGA